MEIKNLSFRYPKSERLLFKDLNWHLSQGRFHFLFGANGVGKTTLFDIITGFIPCEYEADDIIKKEDILYQMQGVPMIRTIKGKDLAELIFGADGSTDFRNNRSVSELHYIDDFAKEKAAYLFETEYGLMSVGERRWLTIVLFCQLDRELYIFDEPTAGLDVEAAKSILSILERLVSERKKTLLVTTHRLEEVTYVSDFEVSVLANQQIAYQSSKQEFEIDNAMIQIEKWIGSSGVTY